LARSGAVLPSTRPDTDTKTHRFISVMMISMLV
jgi:hypothetical protein